MGDENAMSARKECDVEYTRIENDEGRQVDGVVVKCVDCEAETESYGHGDNSVRRCLALMRETCECEDGEDAFFVCDEVSN